MSDLRPKIRAALSSFLSSQDGHHLQVDLLRIIEEEALLMKETARVCDVFDKDPMGQLGAVSQKMERLKQQLKVTSYNKVETVDGYTRIDAVVTITVSCRSKASSFEFLQLTFRYERKRRSEGEKGCHVRYSIEFSRNYERRENLIVVEVWSPQDGPSPERAVCINETMEQFYQEDEDNSWEDIDDDGEADNPDDGNAKREASVSVDHQNKKQNVSASEETSKTTKLDPHLQAPKRKRQKLNDTNEPNEILDGQSDSNVPQEGDGPEVAEDAPVVHDEFLAYLDQDLLHDFVRMTGLQPVDDGTAFFLLMTFPFYEHEWDLVGFLLDETFGGEENDPEEEDEQ